MSQFMTLKTEVVFLNFICVCVCVPAPVLDRGDMVFTIQLFT